MLLSYLLDGISIASVSGAVDIEVSGFSIDSREVQRNQVFVALAEPEMRDRREFVRDAAGSGACAVIVNRPLKGADRELGLTEVLVPDVQTASALMAARFHGYPARKLSLIGVTGTKGKTTTSYLVAGILNRSNLNTGVIGTIAVRYGKTAEVSKNTTPHAIELQRILAKMVDEGMSAVSMEVSSHALKLHRVAACSFDVGVFTNLGWDHMNFHSSPEDYVQSKAMLMASVAEGMTVVNTDDPRGSFMASASLCECLTYGLGEDAVLRALDLETSLEGSSFRVRSPYGSAYVETSLAGTFNVYNSLAAMGAAIARGIPLREAVEALRDVGGVPGRLESVDTGELGFKVLVDYAHTAESMENVLSTLKAIRPRKLITVFGCGGDRDRVRRPVMGKVAAKYSDMTFVTSDNPRTEDPSDIISDIVNGLQEDGVDPCLYEVVEDRGKAIENAIELASPGDIVVILGKGHEDYQIIGDTKRPFDDREAARKALLNQHRFRAAENERS